MEKLIKKFEEGTVCPTCNRALDDVDHTDEIEKINIKRTTRRGTTVYYSINTPSQSEIRDASKMVWGMGTSWAEAIETGEFSGDADLTHYIFELLQPYF